MTRSDYMKAIWKSTSKAEIDSLNVRSLRDRDLDWLDRFNIGMAASERLNTPVTELPAEATA